MNSDTIVAPATPYGVGGIAVVRLNGPESKQIVNKLIKNKTLSTKLVPRNAFVFKLVDEQGQEIDETVITYFKAPASYTGDDLIEIACHGNPVLVDKIVATCCKHGARIAEPGEFTKIAYINGKLDLIQAEAVGALIHSQSEESSKLNFRLLKGELSKKILQLQADLISALGIVEFELDISEEKLQPDLKYRVSEVVQQQINIVQNLLGTYKQARLLNRGALVIIVGAPNVGKSTLLNILTETDRAITSERPGTTRDAINVPLLLDGVPINLVDTAGIQQSTDDIELEGVKRTFNYLKDADLIIYIQDTENEGTERSVATSDITKINVINKADLLTNKQINKIQKTFLDYLLISAKTGFNIDELKKSIKSSLGINPVLSNNSVSITNQRQHEALLGCLSNLKSAESLLNWENIAYELVSIELRDALTSIDSILGKTTPDDILNNIFGKFCVGK